MAVGAIALLSATAAPVGMPRFAHWIDGTAAAEPEMQVQAIDADTFVIRQSVRTNFEAPFLYLMFGTQRAMLLDTGAGGLKVRPTIDKLIDGWQARHGGRPIHLVVAVLRLGPVEDTTMGRRELADHRQVACAAPSYLVRHGKPRTPADLAGHQCLGFVNWSGRTYAEWRFGRAGAMEVAMIRPRLRVNDGRALVAAAIAGHGIILQPQAVVAEAMALGALVPVLADYVAPSRPMVLLHVTRERSRKG